MHRLTRSDLADLARYSLSLQQSALALWSDALLSSGSWDDGALSAPPNAQVETAREKTSSRSGTSK